MNANPRMIFAMKETKRQHQAVHQSSKSGTIFCGGGSNIQPEPILKVKVHKTKVCENANHKGTGVKSLLYEARMDVFYNRDSIEKLKSGLKNLFPNMGLAQMADNQPHENFVETRFGKCPA